MGSRRPLRHRRQRDTGQSWRKCRNPGGRFKLLRGECRSSREAPRVPEVYVFHVGGPHGDHNNFDFWPPRKEVFLPGNNPVSLLEAINTTAITRLMLPEGRAGEPSALASEWSTWAEAYIARDRLRSSFAYSPSGTAAGANIRLWSTDPRVEDNPSATFDPWRVVQNYLDLPEAEYMAHLPGPSLPTGIDSWAESVKRRLGETSEEVRRTMAKARRESLAESGGVRIESYRAISTEQALLLIAGLG